MRLSVTVLLAISLASIAGALFTTSLSHKLLLGFYAVSFGGVFLIALPNLWRGNVALITVTDRGIEQPSAGLIRWGEIEKVALTHVVGQPALGIWTRDPFIVARRGPAWMWLFDLFNRMMGFPPISFTSRVAPIEDLYAAIETRRIPTSTGNYEHAEFGAGSTATGKERFLVDDANGLSRPFEAGSRRGTRTTR
jgi:hypothetical protein